MTTQKTIALFGGSFNPPHQGHIDIANYVQATLPVDETWLLFSESPHKDVNVYAPLEHRMAMAQILLKHSDPRIKLSDMEARIAQQIGTHETFYILQAIQQTMPDCKFIWVMGADSFADFHTWKMRDEMMESTLVAVVDRCGYRDRALSSETAIQFCELACDLIDSQVVTENKNGWCMLDNSITTASSTELRDLIGNNADIQRAEYAAIVPYIKKHGLYSRGGTA